MNLEQAEESENIKFVSECFRSNVGQDRAQL